MRFDRRFLIVLSASLLWALVVSAMFYRLAAGSAGRRGEDARKEVVVASRPLPVGATIDRDALKLREVPESLFPAGAFSRLEDVIDRPVISPIQPEEPVVEARLAGKGSGIGLAPLIPPGMRAMSMRVNDVVGVAGFILPGMRVDVLVTGHAEGQSDTVTRTVLQNVGVLSAGQTTQTDGKSQSILTPVVTLLVSPQDAEALTLANNDGHIQLVLRNSADEKTVMTAGSRLHDLYGGPAPAETPAALPRPAPIRTRADVAAIAPAVAPLPVAQPPLVPLALKPASDEIEVIHGKVKTVEIFAKRSVPK
jgi:pilus assembly protein CpaB